MPLHRRTDGNSGRSATGRLLFGFALGCGLLLLTWAARNLVTTSAPGAPGKQGQPSEVTQVAGKTPEIPKEATGTGVKARKWAEPSKEESTPTHASLSPVELGGALLGVIALIIAAAFLLRRLLRGTRLAPGRHKVLELIDALPLGPRRFVYVINLQGRTLVLGAGGDRVSLLAEYGEDEWSPAMELKNPILAAATSTAPRIQGQARQAAQCEAEMVKTTQIQARAKAEAPDHEKPQGKQHSGRRRARPAPGKKARSRPSGRLDRAVDAYRRAMEAPDNLEEKNLPAGARRVPPAFRHLVARAMEERQAP